MKRFLQLTIIFIILVPIIVYSETCDKNKISISSITMNNKSETVTELDKASAQDKNINLNLSMAKLGDSIDYKIIVKNDSNENYVLDKNSISTESNYIDYNIISDDNSNTIKANSTKEFLINIKYKNKISDSDYASGEYIENKDIKLSISTYNSNPKTSRNIIIIFISLIITFITVYITKNNKKVSNVSILLFLLLIPTLVYAECKYDINIKSKVLIEGNDAQAVPTGPYYNINKDKYYQTLDNAVNSARNNQTIKVLENVSEEPFANVPNTLKGLKIDLNSKTVEFINYGEDHHMINNGEIEIINTSEEWGTMQAYASIQNNGTLTIKEKTEIRAELDVVNNAGTIYIQGGRVSGMDTNAIVNTGTVYMSSGNAGSYSAGIINYNKVYLTGGEVGGYTGIKNYGTDSYLSLDKNIRIWGSNLGINNEGTIDVNGGVIESEAKGIFNTGTITINNGSIDVASPEQWVATGIDNDYSGILTVKGGNIVARSSGGTKVVGINNNGTATITNGSISASGQNHMNKYGIYSSGTTTVLAGNITSDSYGIHVSANSILTLGKDDNSVNTSSPLIEAIDGSGTGLDINENGIVNYYDGVIKAASGTNFCILGNVTNIPNGYTIKTRVVDEMAEAYLDRE